MGRVVSDQLLGAALDAWEGRPLVEWRGEWGVPRLEVYARVGSTMDVARGLAEAGAPAGTLVLAEEQTAGRGRGGRPWHSAPGWSVHLSLLLRPRGGEAALLSTLPLRLGLAVAEAVEAASGVEARVKWPNDVVTERGRKLSGILCEAAVGGMRGTFVVAGIGVNVGQDAEDFPPELRETATSVSREAGRLVPRPLVLGDLLSRVLPLVEAPGSALDSDELEALRRRDALAGRALTVDGRRVGRGAGISADGALRVSDAAGSVREVRAGTVRVVEETP